MAGVNEVMQSKFGTWQAKKCQKLHFRCQICLKTPFFIIVCALNVPNMPSYGLSGMYGLLLDGKCAILSVFGSNEDENWAKMPF